MNHFTEIPLVEKIYKLPQNKNKSFVGIQMNGKGFLLSHSEAKTLIKKDPKNQDCIKHFLIGRDINQNWEMKPSRQIIDFNDWRLEKASKYKDLIQIVESTVKKERDMSTSTGAQMKRIRSFWWQHKCLASNMRKQIESLEQFIVTSLTAKHRFFIMQENNKVLPDVTTVVIASNSYSLLGVLSSVFHIQWSKYNGSTLGEGSRYTSKTCFENFPFPKEKENPIISSLMQKIEFYRRETCKTRQYGLTTLYNEMEEDQGSHKELRQLHKKLDEAVAELYHFPTKNLSSKKEILKHLINLNREIYESFYGNSVS